MTGDATETSEYHFSRNYRDQCVRSGTGAGFQFEFYCDDCGDTWRSPFEMFVQGRGAGWFSQVSSFAGNMLGNVGYEVGRAAEGLADQGWGPARDKAFQRAVRAAEAHFTRCPRCHRHVCDHCFNLGVGLCVQCVPDTAAEVAAARQDGLLQTARENAMAEGHKRAAGVDVRNDRTLVCPACGTDTHGGRFCPECGHNLTEPGTCAQCHAVVPAGSKFCPECGARTQG